MFYCHKGEKLHYEKNLACFSYFSKNLLMVRITVSLEAVMGTVKEMG